MNTRLTITTAAIAIAGAITLGAQTPQNPPAQQSTPQNPPAMAGVAQPITITGCVKPESDVAGLHPNPVEKVGVSEDYILTNVKMASSSASQGLAVSTMYEIEGIAGAELKKHINHEVELTGTVAADRKADDPAPDFRATGMKMMSATCPSVK